MFDPFKDFASAGYLRNTAREKDPQIVKQIEHALFTANLQDATAWLKKRRNLQDDDFLKVHQILFGGFYPWAGRCCAAGRGSPSRSSSDLRPGTSSFAGIATSALAFGWP